MLSRADRLLAEYILSRRLIQREVLEQCAAKIEETPGRSLAEVLVDEGGLDPETHRTIAEELDGLESVRAPDLSHDRQLGEFRLIREIGRGGMGIVYEAEQQSLARLVAVKILPAGAALDDRLAARFLREARAAGRLRHPGIVPVYASGRAEGVLYFAMELVDGQPLSRILAADPMPAEQAARITLQVARALEHAHQAGVVHRDVKPENILISKGGEARLADFGLAWDVKNTAITRHALGTPAYMAPEQAAGEAVDGRSDVYALGAVLYHMLAGVPPYPGEIPAAILARLLTEAPPPLGPLAPATPPELIAICNEAMERQRDRRFKSAAALSLGLERFLTPDSRTVAGAVPSARRQASSLWMTAAAGLVALAGLAAFWLSGKSTVPEEFPEVATSTPSTSLRALKPPGGSVRQPTLSRDDRTLAFVRKANGKSEILLQSTDNESPVDVTIEAQGRIMYPALSPDASRLAFTSREGLWLLEIESQERRLLLEEQTRGVTWAPDGRRVAFTIVEGSRRRMWVLDVATGERNLVTSMDTQETAWSPVGEQIAFVSRRSGGRLDIFTIPVGGGEPVRVTRDSIKEWSPAWSADGQYLYYGTGRLGAPGLSRVRIDERTGAPRGEPQSVTPMAYPGPFEMAAGSDRIALTFTNRTEGVFRSSIDEPNLGVTLSMTGTALVRDPQPSPDGQLLLCTESVEHNLFLRDLSAPLEGAKDRRRLTSGPWHDGGARWSPDGNSIAFHSDRTGSREIWIIRSDGTGLEQWTDMPGRDVHHPVWSPDGNQLAVTVQGEGGFLLDLTPSRKKLLERLPSPSEGNRFEPWSWSGDGLRLAGTAGGIVVLDIRRGSFRRLTDAGSRPSWAVQDTQLLFALEDAMHRVDVGSGKQEEMLSVQPGRLRPGFGIAAGQVYYAIYSSDDRVWILDL